MEKQFLGKSWDRVWSLRPGTGASRGGREAACLAILAVLVLLLTGCNGMQPANEREARAGARSVADTYRPNDQRPVLPQLTNDSLFADYLKFGILNQPGVEAAFYDWQGSIERITQERSLPDPRLTFEMFIQDAITSVMPGLMMDFPGPGKLTARARVAVAESETKYFAFETSVIQAAFAVKKAFYELHFLDERIRVNREMLALLADLEKLARAQTEVGKVTLQDVLRAQIERDRLQSDVAGLEDSRGLRLARFKAALGIGPDQPDPPTPHLLEPMEPDLAADRLWETALAHNPRLKAMSAEVRRAEASFALARKSRVPDFTAGVEADVKASPVIFNPQFSVTLPIWRDKIAAQIAEAQAGKRAAEARLSAEQIALAVEFAEQSFMYREAARNLGLLRDQLLPMQRQSLEVARSGYLAGQIDFFNLTDAEQTLLRFAMAEVDAREQRNIALAEISLLVLGVPPPGAPLLEEPGAPVTGGSEPSSGTNPQAAKHH